MVYILILAGIAVAALVTLIWILCGELLDRVEALEAKMQQVLPDLR